MKNFYLFNNYFILMLLLILSSCSPSNIASEYERAHKLVSNKANKNWQEANSILKKILPYNKKNDNFLAFYAISEMKLGNNIIAEEYIKDAISISPKNSQYHYFLADIYYQNSLLEKAMKSLKICLELEPKNTQAFILLIKIEFKIYAYQIKSFIQKSDSVQKLESQKFKEIPQALYILAAKHYHYNEMRDAFINLKKAEKLAPNKPETLLNLAIICDLRQSNQFQPAKKYYSRYLQVTKKDKKNLSTRSQVAKRLKQLP